jgi:DNA-binding NarL/FixJ family response regulator
MTNLTFPRSASQLLAQPYRSLSESKWRASVVIADESDVMLLGILALIDKSSAVKIIGTTATFSQLILFLSSRKPMIVIVGNHFSDEKSLNQIIMRVKAASLRSRIIMLGTIISGNLIRELFSIGLSAYLYRGDNLSECLPDAIQVVQQNRPFVSPTVSTEMLINLQSPLFASMMDQEALEILRRLTQGETVDSIALQLNITSRRVYWIREKLRNRFGVLTNEHLISRALAEGFGNNSE